MADETGGGPLHPDVAAARGQTLRLTGQILAMTGDLLPTPVAQPSGNTPEDHLRKKPGREQVTDLAIIAENDLFKTGGKLLPTPDAYSGSRGGSQHPEKRRAGGHTVSIADVVEQEVAALLPTPKAGDADFGLPRTSGRPPEKSTHLATRIAYDLLPTPNTMEHLPAREGEARERQLRRGDPNGSRRQSMGNLREDILDAETEWGKYDPAIRRWEQIRGPVPAPTQPSKTGKAQLSARFVEWMMGLSPGWVTGLGLSRVQELKMLGNGVVPQQALLALEMMKGQRF